MNLEIKTCGSCGAPIVWATTAHGRRIPVDPDPVPDGNLELLEMSGVLVAHVLTVEREAELERELLDANRAGVTPTLALFKTHFATCPSAETHRRRRDRVPDRTGGAT